MNFRIQEPNHELTDGYLILLIKITVVISFAWMIGILIIYTYPCITWSGNKYPPALIMLDKHHVFSWICSIIALFFYTKRILKKYNNRLIIEFNFEKDKNQISLELLNIYTGKTKKETFEADKFKAVQENVNDKLYGKQRVFHFSNQLTPITTLNIDRCAWRKFPDIDLLIQKLEEFQ
jgi:hypothetical protein